MKAIGRQTIVTWYKPEEKMPKEYCFVVATISMKAENITYDHTLVIANWADDDEGYNGWIFDDQLANRFADKVTIHAWCDLNDLEPYGMGVMG